MKKTRPGFIAGYAMKHLFKESATTQYIASRNKDDKYLRGKLMYDKDTCIGCRMCSRDCPSGAISVVNIGTKEEKVFEATLDLSRCIFCCQCVDSCPKNCLSFTPETELAAFDRKSLKVILDNER